MLASEGYLGPGVTTMGCALVSSKASQKGTMAESGDVGEQENEGLPGPRTTVPVRVARGGPLQLLMRQHSIVTQTPVHRFAIR